MTESPATTSAERAAPLLEAARRLGPEIEAGARQAELDRRLSPSWPRSSARPALLDEVAARGCRRLRAGPARLRRRHGGDRLPRHVGRLGRHDRQRHHRRARRLATRRRRAADVRGPGQPAHRRGPVDPQRHREGRRRRLPRHRPLGLRQRHPARGLDHRSRDRRGQQRDPLLRRAEVGCDQVLQGLGRRGPAGHRQQQLLGRGHLRSDEPNDGRVRRRVAPQRPHLQGAHRDLHLQRGLPHGRRHRAPRDRRHGRPRRSRALAHGRRRPHRPRPVPARRSARPARGCTRPAPSTATR